MNDFQTVAPSAFVDECRRIVQARLAAKTQAERDDCDWALNYVFQMHRTGRFEEYVASRKAVTE